VFDEALQTLYLLASSMFPAAKLIADIASMAIMPLIARLVWLLGEESACISSGSNLPGSHFAILMLGGSSSEDVLISSINR
jgi:hypothetical protein